MAYRKPSYQEEGLIRALVDQAGSIGLPADWTDRLRVEEMEDGGMGSLRLSFSADGRATIGPLGRVAAEYPFTDADGVEVIASLHVNADEVPFELDVWKTDFSPLRRLPDL